jgi:Family of unknown function (DUF6527)
MDRLERSGTGALAFHCPGCKCHHEVYVRPTANLVTGASWEWNGSMEKPTFTPSLMVSLGFTDPNRSPKVCHSFVTDGQIKYLSDCTHALAGQTVDLPEVER